MLVQNKFKKRNIAQEINVSSKDSPKLENKSYCLKFMFCAKCLTIFQGANVALKSKVSSPNFVLNIKPLLANISVL